MHRDVLEDRARLLELSVRRQSNVKPEDVLAQRPGGVANPDQSAMGWLTYVCWLTRMHATGPQQVGPARPRWDARAMEDMRAAHHAEPVHLTLQAGRKVAVHPKGDQAMLRLILNQFAMRWVLERRMALQEADPTASIIEALQKALTAESQLTNEFVWILVHPGPGLPWRNDGGWEHQVPGWIGTEVSGYDLIAVRSAHIEVNFARIAGIAERSRQFASTGDESMPLAAFMGVMSDELHVRGQELAERWSWGEIFASSLAKVYASQQAKEKAEQRADA
ncbi:MAG TPA: hypothetical protein VE869_03645 [Gemmatimonas sp.]|nr:hypothetical protein [Gemmatimonas sp.]